MRLLSGILLALFLFFPTPEASAASMDCRLNGSQVYCQYTGRVKELYVNATTILFYFELPIDKQQLSGLGVDVPHHSAGMVSIVNNPDYAKLFYSTALAAQSSSREVTIQMRFRGGSYMTIDRIWLPE